MKHTTDVNAIREVISQALKRYVKDQETTIQKFCKEHEFNVGNMYSYLGGKRKGFSPEKMQELCSIVGLEYVNIRGLKAKEGEHPIQHREIEEIHNRRLILDTLSEEYNKRSDKERLQLLKAVISNINQEHQQSSIKDALNQLSMSILNELMDK